MEDQTEKKIFEELQPLDQTKGKKGKRKLEDFDDILEMVGSEGKYQKIILYGILTPLIIISPLFIMNKIFMLSVPNHHCHVPGRPNHTDLETWKNMTLPKELGPDGLLRFSQCQRYFPDGSGNTTSCEEWEFDKTDYDNTMATDFAWVCDKAHRPTSIFTTSSIGNVVGTIIFGQAADRWGRKPFFFLTIFIYVLFQTVSLFTPQNFKLYLALQFLAGTAFPFLFSAPCLIAAETSGKDYRAWIYTVAWMVWVLGNSFLPLIAWLLRSWFLIGLLTTVPAALLLLLTRVLQESPRWLLSVGRIEESATIMRNIARINGRFIPPEELDEALRTIRQKEEAKKNGKIGVWTLFTKRRLAINTIMLCISWSMNGLIYYGLTLNTTNMSGNEFFNYFLLGIIELPAGWIGGILLNKTGRRWTQACFFLLCSCAFLVASLTVLSQNLTWLVMLSALTAKFAMTVTSLVVYLQGTEIFPTQLRSTGSGLASTMASVVGTLGPHVVFLGTYHVALPYVIFTALALLGTISSACLPETFNMSLPETIEDSNAFGKNQKFWSYLPKENNPKAASILENQDEKKQPKKTSIN